MDKHFRKVISYLLLITFIIIQPINAIAEENLKSNVQLSNTNLTPIMGKSQATKEQMVEYLSINNPNKTKEYINSFVTWTIEESNIENVRADVAFALMMKETGFLKFGGSVSETQNNFGGLGATDGETAGASFESVQMGIRAVVQHLKAYASQDPLSQDCIDPRYNLVSPKGKAPNVEDLGGRWAVPGYDVNKYRDFETALLNNDTYGQHIVNMVNRIKDIPTSILPPPEIPAKIKEVRGNNIGYKGVDYTITANATSPDGVEYKYWLADRETNEWKLLKDYSEINSYTWKPDKVGKYRLVVHVRGKNSTKKYDDYGYKDIEVKVLPPAKVTGVKGNDIGYKDVDYRMATNATSVSGVEYKYWLNDKATNEWKLLKDYSESNSYVWKPEKLGNYRLVVHIRDKSSTKEYDDYGYKDIEVKVLPPAKIKEVKGNNIGYKDVDYRMTTNATSVSGVEYKYWLNDKATNEWKLLKDYSEINSYTWKPEKLGKYRLVVHIRDKNSTKEYDDYGYKDIEIKVLPPAKIKEVKGNNIGHKDVNYTLTTNATSVSGVEYKYWLNDKATNEWKLLKDYSEINSYTWKPEKLGKYRLVVHIRDKNSTKKYDDYGYKDIEVKVLPPAKMIGIKASSIGCIGQDYIMIANATGANGVEYRYWLNDKQTNEWKLLRDYSEFNSYTWKPDKVGKYRLVVHVRDKSSIKEYDDYAYKDVEANNYILYNKTIMLDPGHGGSWPNGNPGSVNNNLNIAEKDLNNSLTKRIAKKLTDLGAKVIYTRLPDKEIDPSLEKRAQLVNEKKPDLFLSIHHDGSTNKSASGISTHYSSYRPGIETKDAYVIYKGKKYPFVKEVKNWSGGNSGIMYLDNGVKVTRRINDVMVYDSTPSDAAVKSKKIAEDLFKSIYSLGFSKNSYIKDHNLYMTRWTNVPSVLLEAGFVTNDKEVLRVSNPTFQDKIAEKAVEAIKKIFSY